MVGGKMKLRYFFFFIYMEPGFIFNNDSHRDLCSWLDSIRIPFSNCSRSILHKTDSLQIDVRFELYTIKIQKSYIYIYISCTYTHKIEFNFVINRVRLHDRFHEIFAPFPRRSLRIDREKRSRPRFKIRQNSWCWILDWRRREDPTTTARFSVFLARLSAENTDEFRSRNTPGLAPCGQTSKGLGTLGRRWIEARLLGCRLASARRSSLRIAGQPTASSTIGLQPPSG